MPYKDHQKKLEYDRQYKEARGLRGLCSCGQPKEDRRRKWCYSCKPLFHKYEADKNYRAAHPEKTRSYARTYHQKLRHEAIMAYGGYRCACPGCDVTTPEFLGLDHIHGGGNAERRRVNHNLFSWLKKQGWPAGYQVLCHNCNLSKGFYGECPHANVLKLILKNLSSDPVGELERGRVTESCLSDNTASSDLSVLNDRVQSICGKGV